jgi:hypothetical protein
MSAPSFTSAAPGMNTLFSLAERRGELRIFTSRKLTQGKFKFSSEFVPISMNPSLKLMPRPQHLQQNLQYNMRI